MYSVPLNKENLFAQIITYWDPDVIKAVLSWIATDSGVDSKCNCSIKKSISDVEIGQFDFPGTRGKNSGNKTDET